jgi:hypothetical protein
MSRKGSRLFGTMREDYWEKGSDNGEGVLSLLETVTKEVDRWMDRLRKVIENT